MLGTGCFECTIVQWGLLIDFHVALQVWWSRSAREIPEVLPLEPNTFVLRGALAGVKMAFWSRTTLVKFGTVYLVLQPQIEQA